MTQRITKVELFTAQAENAHFLFFLYENFRRSDSRPVTIEYRGEEATGYIEFVSISRRTGEDGEDKDITVHLRQERDMPGSKCFELSFSLSQIDSIEGALMIIEGFIPR